MIICDKCNKVTATHRYGCYYKDPRKSKITLSKDVKPLDLCEDCLSKYKQHICEWEHKND